MDEDIADVPGSSKNDATKPKKKAVAPKKVDKEKKAVKTTSAKKPKTVPTKAANKVTLSKEEPGPPKDKKKTVSDLVCEAVKVLGDPRKGASAQAIKKYVISNSENASANLNFHIKQALVKGIEKGILVRPPASKDVTGAVGYFRLAKVEAPKRTNKTVKREKIDSEHASDSEATEKPPKPRKRNLSDTYIQEMKSTLTSTPKPLIKPSELLKEIKQIKAPKKIASDKDHKSMESHSSVTEEDFKSNNPKSSKEPTKKTKSDKSKVVKADSTSKVKSTAKKLYGGSDGKVPKSTNKSKVKK